MTGINTLYHLRNSNLSVILVEQNKIGYGVTANSTGKLTYLQDSLYEKITKNFDENIDAALTTARETVSSYGTVMALLPPVIAIALALLTKEAAAALKEVSDELLLQGYRLKIFDAYRPQMAVEHFKNWARDVEDTRMKAYFYPELDKSVLFVSGYIASRSGHSRGSTVDLTLFDMTTGKEVDMGGAYDFFGDISHSARTEGLTAEQIENRAILKKAMEAHGFKSISTEWWHFQLKNEPYPSTYFNFPVKTLEG